MSLVRLDDYSQIPLTELVPRQPLFTPITIPITPAANRTMAMSAAFTSWTCRFGRRFRQKMWLLEENHLPIKSAYCFRITNKATAETVIASPGRMLIATTT